MGNGKVVLITGASRGIGRESAFCFAREGFDLIITYNFGEDEIEETQAKCKEFGDGEVFVVKLDISKSEDRRNCLEKVKDKFGKVDVLINNAGVVVWKYLVEQSEEEVVSQIRTNLEGPIDFTRIFLPIISDDGVIINVSSLAGKTGYDELTTYCASKFGLRGFSQALAQEMKGIKVYSINPGATKTRMTDFVGDEPFEVGKIIFETAIGKHGTGNGDDIDVGRVID